MRAAVSFFHQRIEERPVGIEDGLAALELVGAAALEHVGAEGPRRAAEAEQGFLALELRLHALQRLAHVIQPGGDPHGIEPIELGLVIQPEVHLDAAGIAELEALAEGLGNHEDVGEDDRRIEGEAPERLQGDLGGELGRLHHLEEGRACAFSARYSGR